MCIATGGGRLTDKNFTIHEKFPLYVNAINYHICTRRKLKLYKFNFYYTLSGSELALQSSLMTHIKKLIKDNSNMMLQHNSEQSVDKTVQCSCVNYNLKKIFTSK